MNQYQSISDLKDSAKNLLSGKFGNAILLNLTNNAIVLSVTFVISMIISTVIGLMMVFSNGNMETYQLSFGASAFVAILEYLLNLICAIFTGVFSTGIALFFLNLASGRTATVANLFYGFQYLFHKSLVLSAVTNLIYSLCLLPYNVCRFLASEGIPGNWMLYAVIAFAAGMIIYLPIHLSISQAFFLLLDFPSRSAGDILQQSIRLMKGKKGRLFLMELSFLPLQLLGVLSFGIGNLWITPYVYMTTALFFLDIMKPAASSTNNC